MVDLTQVNAIMLQTMTLLSFPLFFIALFLMMLWWNEKIGFFTLGALWLLLAAVALLVLIIVAQVNDIPIEEAFKAMNLMGRSGRRW